MDRCRAVAYATCIHFLNESGTNSYEYVYCCQSWEELLSRLKEMSEGSALVWADFNDEGTTSQARTTIGFAMHNVDIHIIVTLRSTSAESRAELCKNLHLGRPLNLAIAEATHEKVTRKLKKDIIKLREIKRGVSLVEALGIDEIKKALLAGITPLYGRAVTIYDDDDHSLVLCVRIDDIAFLHSLRNVCLNNDFTISMEKTLCVGNNEDLCIKGDFTYFAEQYESVLSRLDVMTPHQKKVVMEIEDVFAAFRCHHVKAPAGAGKTFVAVHFLIKTLMDSSSFVLFVAPTSALCYLVINWHFPFCCTRVTICIL